MDTRSRQPTARELIAEWSFDRFAPDRLSALTAAAAGVEPPLPYKGYRTAPVVALRSDVGLRLGGAGEVLFGPARRERRDLPGSTWLSTLLHYGAGVVRAELLRSRALHRGYPSARCLYPVDVYLSLRHRAGGVPAGVYYYHPFRHALRRLAPRPLPECRQAARAPDLACYVAANFGRTAHRYGDFGYRLCTQEAGLAAANLALAARALGGTARVRLLFADGELHRALGLSGVEESVLAVVDVSGTPFPASAASPHSGNGSASPHSGAGSASPNSGNGSAPSDSGDGLVPPDSGNGFASSCSGDGLAPSTDGVVADVDPRSYLDARWYPELVRFNRASFLGEAHAAHPRVGDRPDIRVPHRREASRGPRRAAGFDLPPPGDLPELDIAEAWRQRSAGATDYLCPYGAALSVAELGQLFAAVAAEPASDTRAAEPGIEYRCVVTAVPPLSPGVYGYVAAAHRLLPVRVRDHRDELQATYVKTNINLRNVPVCLFPIADYEAYLARFGPRGYRIANMSAGMAAQRLSLAAAALGLGARCSDSLDEARTQRLLGIRRPRQPLLQVMVFRGDHGRRRRAALVL